MYDKYTPPFTLNFEGHEISVEKDRENLIYRRTCNYQTVEKTLLNTHGEFLINPIEPVNLPKPITSSLLIDFEHPVVIGPGTKQKIYLTFPVETGIFIVGRNGDHELVDMLTLSNIKYTLYGTPNNGVVCRYWKSKAFTSYPHPDTRYEGDIELDIINDTTHWMEVTKAVFNAYGMKIYYGKEQLSMRAFMRIINRNLAETGFMTYTTTAEFKRSIELYTSRKVILSGNRGIMEHGL
ncbi:MAG: uncharacterized protein PWR29_1381 [Methanolobus sp.]|jgi:hypothetical protein|nr:uncharacterized protein [Methanolobus sp.]MDK2912424.1 uncharacterized protein [Methanolobus sp.]MDN5310252.1 uncharacterized protein [Methanolobus sp.]